MNRFKILFILLGVIPACNNEDDIIKDCINFPDTVNYTLAPVNGGMPITLSFQDFDGEGGNAPTITTGILAANTIYTGEVQILSKNSNPIDDYTAEIAEEAVYHQFFYQTVGNIDIAYDDTDADGNPLGIRSTLTTGVAGNGTITITLRHEPDKTASGVADGDISNAGGETDIEVTFDVTVM